MSEEYFEFDLEDAEAEVREARYTLSSVVLALDEVKRLRAQLARQTAEILDVKQRYDNSRLCLNEMNLRAEQAEARVLELEARLPHYHNEAQCGVIKERMEKAEAENAATRGALEGIIKRTNGPSYTMAGVIAAIAKTALEYGKPIGKCATGECQHDDSSWCEREP